RRLIARSRADLEHLHPFADLKLLGHVGDDVGLADRLPAFDGQRMILIGLLAKRAADEFLARYALKRRQHALVADALPAQAHDQLDLALLDLVHGRLVAHWTLTLSVADASPASSRARH